MADMIAFCGLNCSKCTAYLATQNDDDSLRRKMSEMLDKKYGIKTKPEDINCDGCHSTSNRLLEFCSSCEVRKCGMEKKFNTCADCKDQPCDHLTKFHTFSPDAKAAFMSLLK